MSLGSPKNKRFGFRGRLKLKHPSPCTAELATYKDITALGQNLEYNDWVFSQVLTQHTLRDNFLKLLRNWIWGQ